MTRKIGSRYSVTGIIGRGTCGTVWEGTGPDGPVAVKLLREDLAADQTLIARFVQERTVLTSLVHPNIVAVRDLVVDGTDLALVMDLVRGSDLRVRLDAKGALPPGQAAALAADVAAGLAAAHARGVVHRDVKPENVLLDRETATARLTDFGIARLVDGPRRTRATRIVGTPDYLAPEVIEGCPPGPPVDVYALGTLMFELLTGWTPFGGGHPGAVLRRHVTEPVPQVPGMPRLLGELVASCLSKAPAARLTAAEVAGRLRVLAPHLTGLPALRVPDPRAALDPVAVGAGSVPMTVGAVPLVRGDTAADDTRTTHLNLMRPIREPLGPSAPIPDVNAASSAPRPLGQGASSAPPPASDAASGAAGSGAAMRNGTGAGRHAASVPAPAAALDETALVRPEPETTASAPPVSRKAHPRTARVHRFAADRLSGLATDSHGNSRVPAVAALTALGLVAVGGYSWLHDHEAAPSPGPGVVTTGAGVTTATSSMPVSSAPAPAATQPVGPLALTALAEVPAPPSTPVGAVRYAVAGSSAYVFTTGSDGVVRYAEGATSPGAHYGPWTPIPGLSSASTEPAVVARASGSLELYVVSGSDQLIHRSVLIPGSPWSAWTTLPGIGSTHVAGAPAAVALTTTRTELVVASASGSLLASSGPAAPGGSWLPWHEIAGAGPIKPGVALTTNGEGTLAAYVIRARDLAILRVMNDGRWGSGFPTGGVGQPEAIYMADGAPYLFIQAVSGAVQVYQPSGADLQGGINWEPLGLTSRTPVGLARYPGTGLTVTVTAPDGSVHVYSSPS